MEAKSRRPLKLANKDALSAGAESSCSTFNLDGRPPKNAMHTIEVKQPCDRGMQVSIGQCQFTPATTSGAQSTDLL